MKHGGIGYREARALNSAEGLRQLNAQLRAIWALLLELEARVAELEAARCASGRDQTEG